MSGAVGDGRPAVDVEEARRALELAEDGQEHARRAVADMPWWYFTGLGVVFAVGIGLTAWGTAWAVVGLAALLVGVVVLGWLLARRSGVTGRLADQPMASREALVATLGFLALAGVAAWLAPRFGLSPTVVFGVVYGAGTALSGPLVAARVRARRRAEG